MSIRPRVIAASCLVVLVLSGCSATSPASSGGTDAPSVTTPLTPYESALAGVQPAKQYFAQAKQIQNFVASCMQKQGFRYIPVDTSKLVSLGQSSAHPDTAQWAATYGYGINHPPAGTSAGTADPAYVNPNDALVAALSDSEQAAYSVALNGAPTSGGDANSDDVVTAGSGGGGCQQKAEKAYPTKDPTAEKQFAGLIEQSNRIPEQVANDPKVASLDSKWASCMSDAGHPDFMSPAKAQSAIEDKYNAYYGSLNGAADPEKVKQMTGFEVEIASADFSCRQKVSYEKQHSAVEIKIEQQFVDDNKKDLDALLAAYGEMGK